MELRLAIALPWLTWSHHTSSPSMARGWNGRCDSCEVKMRYCNFPVPAWSRIAIRIRSCMQRCLPVEGGSKHRILPLAHPTSRYARVSVLCPLTNQNTGTVTRKGNGNKLDVNGNLLPTWSYALRLCSEVGTIQGDDAADVG
eukprot:5285623-Amphidinium_carterae.1